MLTWFSLWPFMTLPFLLSFVLGILPSLSVGGGEVGGALVRQYGVNQLAALMPHDFSMVLIDWFNQASYVEELVLHGVISLNIGLLFYPLFFGLGSLAIRAAAWSAKQELAQSNTLLNRR